MNRLYTKTESNIKNPTSAIFLEKAASAELKIINDFISETEEQYLLGHISSEPQKKTGQRNSIKRYGSALPYNSDIVSDAVPSFLSELCKQLNSNSVTINEYQIGQKIDYHIDSKKSGDVIIVLSLLGDAVMNFKRGKQVFSVSLPRRSLLKMSGDLRYFWKHSIDPVTTTRYSIVFRNSI
jgi:alkylated DNA repair dioxygenase AlkB